MAEKMKVVAITGDHKAEVKEVTKPKPLRNQVLIKMRACMLCTFEQRMFTGEKHIPLPFVGGHELAGEIVELGEGVDPKKYPIGTLVSARLIKACGECYNCRHGRDELCEHVNDVDMSQMDIPGTAGLSEYLNVDTNQIYKFNEGTPDTVVSFAEPLACVLNSIEKGHIELGDDVVVIGGGIMGMMHVMAAKLSGARVILSEPDETRAELGKKLGADIVVNPMKEDLKTKVMEVTDGVGAEAVFNTTPISSIASQALTLACDQGRVIMYSSQHPDKPIEVSPGWLHSHNVIITGAVNPSVRSFTRACELLNKHLIDVTPLLSGTYPMDQCQEAFEAAIRKDTYRIAITFNK